MTTKSRWGAISALFITPDAPAPVAKVQLDIDLKERGIAWRPDNEALPMFDATVREIEDRFKTL
jgi:hypothetical protein